MNIPQEWLELFEQHWQGILELRSQSEFADGKRRRGTSSAFQIEAEFQRQLSLEQRQAYEYFAADKRGICSTCLGTGYYPPFSSPQYRCEDCENRERLEAGLKVSEKLKSESGIPEIYLKYRGFGEWTELKEYAIGEHTLFDDKEGAVEIARRIAQGKKFALSEVPYYIYQNDHHKRRGLFLQGPPGVGKTTLACTIGNYAIDNRFVQVKFYFVAMLMERLKSFGSEEETTSEFLEKICRVPILILDEMNIPKPTDRDITNMMSIVRMRYMRDLTTIFTANAPLAVLRNSWGDQIMEAIEEPCHYATMAGEPLRQKTLGY